MSAASYTSDSQSPSKARAGRSHCAGCTRRGRVVRGAAAVPSHSPSSPLRSSTSHHHRRLRQRRLQLALPRGLPRCTGRPAPSAPPQRKARTRPPSLRAQRVDVLAHPSHAPPAMHAPKSAMRIASTVPPNAGSLAYSCSPLKKGLPRRSRNERTWVATSLWRRVQVDRRRTSTHTGIERLILWSKFN